MGANGQRRSSEVLWTFALVFFLLAHAAQKPKLASRQGANALPQAKPLHGAARRFWLGAQKVPKDGDSAPLKPVDHARQLSPGQQKLCDTFSSLCARNPSSWLKNRLNADGQEDMELFAGAAPSLLNTGWSLFTELVMELAVIKERYLSTFASLQRYLRPFLSNAGEVASDSPEAAVHLAAAAAKGAAAEGTRGATDMNDVRMCFRELTELAKEEHSLAATYRDSALDGLLFHSPPDDSLWAALLDQVATKAAAAAAAAQFGLTATLRDAYREGKEGYEVSLAGIQAVDDRLRMILLQQQDAYAGSRPIPPFLKAILLSFCEGGECNGQA
ncbi:hypothetical protein ACSSS7_003105 [Eimeria intestinalis]